MSDKGLSAVADLNALPGNVPQALETIDPMQRPLWEIDDRILNPFEELPPTMTWGRMGDRPAIERQGIITVSAKPKQGKSLSVYALLTSIVAGTPIDTFTPDSERPRLVVIFDTEMNKPTLQRRARGLYNMLGEQRNRLMIVPLLGVRKSERVDVIEEITAKYQPDIVAIDVVTKLVDDFNSSDENAAFGDWIEKYAENRTVFVVIHQNKSKDDSGMKGHLGSILGEAAVENFSASMKNDVFTLTPVNARNTHAEGAPGVSFTLTDEGAFRGADEVLERQRQVEAEHWRADFSPIFGNDETASYSALIDRLMKKNPISRSSAHRMIEAAARCGAIGKVDEGKNAPYKIT